MRIIVTVFLGLALSGCGTIADKTVQGIDYLFFPDAEERRKARQAADDAKCQGYGFQPGTEAYGNCRLQLEQIRAIERSSTRTRSRAAPVMEGAEQGGKVYDSSECIGPVIMGRCKGSIVPNKAYNPKCYGEWLNGQCTGPMF